MNLDVTRRQRGPHRRGRHGGAARSLTVALSGGTGVICREEGQAAPGQPFATECKLPADAGRLTVRVLSRQPELVSYTTVDRAAGETPEAVRPPARPRSIAKSKRFTRPGCGWSNCTARRWTRKTTTARCCGGIRATHGRTRRWASARTSAPCMRKRRSYLRAAAGRVTGSYLAPKDGEPHYYLGLAVAGAGPDRRGSGSVRARGLGRGLGVAGGTISWRS